MFLHLIWRLTLPLVLLKHLAAEVLPHRPQHFPILQQYTYAKITTAPTTTALTYPVVAPAPAPSPTVTAAAAPPPAPPQRVPPLPLRHGHRAEQVSMGKKSMKNNEFCYHLVLLAKKGVFTQHSKLAKGSIPPGVIVRRAVLFFAWTLWTMLLSAAQMCKLMLTSFER